MAGDQPFIHDLRSKIMVMLRAALGLNVGMIAAAEVQACEDASIRIQIRLLSVVGRSGTITKGALSPVMDVYHALGSMSFWTRHADVVGAGSPCGQFSFITNWPNWAKETELEYWKPFGIGSKSPACPMSNSVHCRPWYALSIM